MQTRCQPYSCADCRRCASSVCGVGVVRQLPPCHMQMRVWAIVHWLDHDKMRNALLGRFNVPLVLWLFLRAAYEL